MALPEPAPALAPLVAPLTTTHRVISYTYDSLYRLITATYSSGEYYHYTYDPVGNRQSLTTHQDVVNYGYDDANRLTSVNGQAYTWDANGNLLSDGTHTYTYDHANRLTQVVSGTLTTQFSYDGLGNRTATTVDGVTTRYALDVAGGLPEVIVATTDGASTQYLQVAGQILAQYDSGTWGYILPDHLGSVRAETDALGQVTVARHFDPFGVPLQADGGSPFGYTGEWWESQVELLYLRTRYYHPATGRFVTRDPWIGDWQRPQSLNGWSYVEGNPINRRDPSGRCWGPLKFLRRVPYYDKACENLDMAIIIAGHPSTTPYQKAQAVAYVEAMAASHIVLAEALVIGGYAWALEAGIFVGECSELLPEEEPYLPPPAPPLEEPYGPLPPELPPGWEPPPLPQEGPYDGPLPFDQLPPEWGEPPQSPGGQDWRSEECRQIWFEYTLARWGKWEAEETLREMEESKKAPEWIKAPVRQAIEAYEARMAKLEEEYRFYGCGSIDWTWVPDEIPW